MKKNVNPEIEKKGNGNRVPDECLSLGFWQLLKCLKPPQVWAFFAIISAFITAAFGYGYKFNLEKKPLKPQKNNKEIQLSQSEMKQFQALKEKEKFFKLYLNYLIAKENYLNSDSEEQTAIVESFRMPFKAYIQEMCQQLEKSSQQESTVGCRGEGNNFIVKFNDDGSVWKIDQNLDKFYLPN
ncbi:MAG: hypothetical protein JW786_04555 [Desulfobacterales bacterium]|nr:hypothetical protein [Desulfobacterales bacterium]